MIVGTRKVRMVTSRMSSVMFMSISELERLGNCHLELHLFAQLIDLLDLQSRIHLLQPLDVLERADAGLVFGFGPAHVSVDDVLFGFAFLIHHTYSIAEP